MNFYRQLEGERCYLTPLDRECAAECCTWLNDLRVSMYLAEPFSLTEEDEREAIDALKSGPSRLFGIVASEGDELIGACGLHSIDHRNGTAEFGIFIGDRRYRGSGYGVEASRLVLDYGFNVLNLHNIMLRTYDYNTRAIECFLKCGFIEVGRRRQAHFFAGARHDVVIMDILAEEFQGPYVRALFDARHED